MSLFIDTYLPPSECHLKNFYIFTTTTTTPPSMETTMDLSYTAPQTPGSAGMSNGSPRNAPSSQSLLETPRVRQPMRGKRLTMPTNDEDADYGDRSNAATKASKRTRVPLSRLAELIVQALAANGPMYVSEIYAYIARNDEHYAKEKERGSLAWKQAVRYALCSKKKTFVMSAERSKRGHLWSIKPGSLCQIRGL